jgi:phosphate transport system substrate-binding protein
MNRKCALVLCAFSLLLVACPTPEDPSFDRPLTPPAKPGGTPLARGAGATFPAGLYKRWIQEFHGKADIDYDDVGSLEGLFQLYEYQVDFAATDWPVDIDNRTTREFPTVAGAVVVVYNISGHDVRLELTPDTLGSIFGGTIKRWKQVRADLPDKPIRVVYRSKGSGTTRIFTEFLSARSQTWHRGPSWFWRVRGGIGVEGSDDVAQKVRAVSNSVGYVEYSYALKYGLRHASIENRAGEFVEASADSIGAAISNPPDMDDARQLARAILIDDEKRHDAYPISALTWIVMPSRMGTRPTEALLGDSGFFSWTMKPPAQAFVGGYGYERLNPDLLKREKKELRP